LPYQTFIKSRQQRRVNQGLEVQVMLLLLLVLLLYKLLLLLLLLL